MGCPQWLCPHHAAHSMCVPPQVDIAVLKTDVSWLRQEAQGSSAKLDQLQRKLDDEAQAIRTKMGTESEAIRAKLDDLQRSQDKLPMKLLVGMCTALAGLASFVSLIWPWLQSLLHAWMG